MTSLTVRLHHRVQRRRLCMRLQLSCLILVALPLRTRGQEWVVMDGFYIQPVFSGNKSLSCSSLIARGVGTGLQTCALEVAPSLCGIEPSYIDFDGVSCAGDSYIKISGGIIEFNGDALAREDVQSCLGKAVQSDVCLNELNSYLDGLTGVEYMAFPSSETVSPTPAPTKRRTDPPTPSPTKLRTDSPTPSPTKRRTDSPTTTPTAVPTTSAPTVQPTTTPTALRATLRPTLTPSTPAVTEATTQSPSGSPTDFTSSKTPTQSPTSVKEKEKEDVSGIEDAPPNESEVDDKPNIYMISGAIAGGVVVLVLLAFLEYKRRSRNAASWRNNKDNVQQVIEVMNFDDVDSDFDWGEHKIVALQQKDSLGKAEIESSKSETNSSLRGLIVVDRIKSPRSMMKTQSKSTAEDEWKSCSDSGSLVLLNSIMVQEMEELDECGRSPLPPPPSSMAGRRTQSLSSHENQEMVNESRSINTPDTTSVASISHDEKPEKQHASPSRRKNPIAHAIQTLYGNFPHTSDKERTKKSKGQSPRPAIEAETNDFAPDPSWNPDDNDNSSTGSAFNPFQASSATLLCTSCQHSSYLMEPLELTEELEGRTSERRPSTPHSLLDNEHGEI